MKKKQTYIIFYWFNFDEAVTSIQVTCDIIKTDPSDRRIVYLDGAVIKFPGTIENIERIDDEG